MFINCLFNVLFTAYTLHIYIYMQICTYNHICICMHTYIFTLHCIVLHCITLHYITLHAYTCIYIYISNKHNLINICIYIYKYIRHVSSYQYILCISKILFMIIPNKEHNDSPVCAGWICPKLGMLRSRVIVVSGWKYPAQWISMEHPLEWWLLMMIFMEYHQFRYSSWFYPLVNYQKTMENHHV